MDIDFQVGFHAFRIKAGNGINGNGLGAGLDKLLEVFQAMGGGVIHCQILACYWVCLHDFSGVKALLALLRYTGVMSTPPLRTPTEQPLIWAICSSASAISGLGDAALVRAMPRGDFDGDFEGVNETGNSLVQSYLTAISPSYFRFDAPSGAPPRSRVALDELLTHDPNPWNENHHGQDRLDLLFHASLLDHVVSQATLDPAGPGAWKARRYRGFPTPTGAGKPWLHHLIQVSSGSQLAAMEFAARLPEVDFNQPDDEGNTVLAYAKTPAVVRFLLKHGADPSHKNHQDDTLGICWSKAQLISGDLSEMRRLLSTSATSQNDQIADVFHLAQTASAGLFLKTWEDAQIPPNATRDGLGILGWAARRLLLCNATSKSSLRASWLLLDALLARPEIVEAASSNDIGLLRIIACHRPAPHPGSAPGPIYDSHLRAQLPFFAGHDLDIIGAIPTIAWKDGSFALRCVGGVEAMLRLGAASSSDQQRWAAGWYAFVLDRLEPGVRRALAEEKLDAKFLHPVNGLCEGLKDHPRAWEFLLDRAWPVNRTEYLEQMAQAIKDNGTPFPDNIDVLSQNAPPEIHTLITNARLTQATPEAHARRSVRL